MGKWNKFKDLNIKSKSINILEEIMKDFTNILGDCFSRGSIEHLSYKRKDV